MAKHPQVPMRHKGRTVMVDEKMVCVLAWLWAAEIETLTSCQACQPAMPSGRIPELAYIQFANLASFERFLRLIDTHGDAELREVFLNSRIYHGKVFCVRNEAGGIALVTAILRFPSQMLVPLADLFQELAIARTQACPRGEETDAAATLSA